MRGRKKKAFALVIGFLFSIMLAVVMLPMDVTVKADGFRCPGCDEWKEDGTDYCIFCHRCDDCVEVCDRCNEVCLECHQELEGEGDTSPCPDCGKCKTDMDYCNFCGRCEECVDLCERCGEICVLCHEELAGESVDEYVPCPDCMKCKADGTIYCHECGRCEECLGADFCLGCGFCVDCAINMGLNCPECEECYEMVGQCENGGEHCQECCELCEECGKCVLATGEETCDLCGLCMECCEANACDFCGMCAEDTGFEDHFCEECGACMEGEEERCDVCGLCVSCCADYLENMGCSCGDKCWLEIDDDHFCVDCGRCFGEVDPCDTCCDAGEQRCEECCSELAELEGCDCAVPLCINDDDFASHLATVHGSITTGHSKSPKSAWSYDNNFHWHDCRLCDEASHISGKAGHLYNTMGICVTCGFCKTDKVVITSQPKDRHGKPTYDGWVSDHYDAEQAELARNNTVSFSVTAYGKDAKKGLHYQWYYGMPGSGIQLSDEDSNDYQYYVSGAKTAKLTYSVPFDGCGTKYGFYCEVSDEYGNKANSSVAYLYVDHDYRVFDDGCETTEKGHTLRCVGGGCEKYGKAVAHTFGEYKWALKADNSQDYLYRACTVCGYREKTYAHVHQFDFDKLISQVYADSVDRVREDEKNHIFEYVGEVNGKPVTGLFNTICHSITCSVPGCNYTLREKHEWGDWHIVNYASKTQPGGLYRVCRVCEMQQTWAKQTWKWHTHPINVAGHAKLVDGAILTTTDANSLQRLLDGVMESEDVDIPNEGDVILIMPSPVEGKIVTGVNVTIDCKIGGTLGFSSTENVTVKELVPGVAYVFAIPKSKTNKLDPSQSVDYEANFINVSFVYDDCMHKKTKTKGMVKATCTEIGYSGDTVCAYCEHLITRGQMTMPTGHGPGVPATENVFAYNAVGEQIIMHDPASDGEYPVYKIHVAQVVSCNDPDLRGSYTGDIVCQKCGELMQKGKYQEPEHDYLLFNEWSAVDQNIFRRYGYQEAVVPKNGQDGYSGDLICKECGKVSKGHVVKSQIITKVSLNIKEWPTYGSKVKADNFTFSDGIVMGEFSWMGLDEADGEVGEWYEGHPDVDEKVLPQKMMLNIRLMPKDGYWFTADSEDVELYVNGKRIYYYGNVELMNDPSNAGSSDYGGMWIYYRAEDMGFCGVAYDVNGGEGNVPCTAVARGTVVELAACSFEAPQPDQIFYWWEINGKRYMPGDEITVNGLVVAKAVWGEKTPADIVGIAADLEGKVGLLFYVNVPDYVLADEGAYVELTLEGDKKTRMISAASVDEKNGIVRRRFAIYADSTQFNSKVNFRMYLSNGTEVPLLRKGVAVPDGGYNYSVIDYCNLAIDSLGSGPMVDLANALIAYGEMAQIYFGHNASGLVPAAALSDTKIDAVLANHYAAKTSGEVPEGLNATKPQGVYLMLDAATTLRVNWKFLEGTDPSTYTYAINGSPATVKYVEGQYCLEVRNIPSKMLADEFSFSISKGGKTYTWTGSTLSWAQTATAYADEATAKIARALYLYNKASRVYFGYKVSEMPTE